MSTDQHEIFYLCPGQGAQAVGMGREWAEASPAAAAIFREADRFLGGSLGAPLSTFCFDGPAARLNETDVSQPAIYVCSVACAVALRERGEIAPDAVVRGASGLSLGEYTALHLAGVFDFLEGLELVALRGRLMQEAAEASRGGMVALIGADEEQANAVCERAAGATTAVAGARGLGSAKPGRTSAGAVLVPANFNAPGQIVLSGALEACERAVAVAAEMGLRATPLTVAGAFHSPLMQPAADALEAALAGRTFRTPTIPVWSNVTARPHEPDAELLQQRLVEQIVNPVRWAESCLNFPNGDRIEHHELAPGSVLKGLMRRIDRARRVISHDKPDKPEQPGVPGKSDE